MPAKQPEAKLKKRIKDFLESEGALVVAIHGGGDPFQEVGISDLLACFKGRFIAVEVKQPGEKPSPMQSRFLRRVSDAGGIAIVAYSVQDVADVLLL